MPMLLKRGLEELDAEISSAGTGLEALNAVGKRQSSSSVMGTSHVSVGSVRAQSAWSAAKSGFMLRVMTALR